MHLSTILHFIEMLTILSGRSALRKPEMSIFSLNFVHAQFLGIY
jgi:hypothetical protein